MVRRHCNAERLPGDHIAADAARRGHGAAKSDIDLAVDELFGEFGGVALIDFGLDTDAGFSGGVDQLGHFIDRYGWSMPDSENLLLACVDANRALQSGMRESGKDPRIRQEGIPGGARINLSSGSIE